MKYAPVSFPNVGFLGIGEVALRQLGIVPVVGHHSLVLDEITHNAAVINSDEGVWCFNDRVTEVFAGADEKVFARRCRILDAGSDSDVELAIFETAIGKGVTGGIPGFGGEVVGVGSERGADKPW